MDSVVAAHACTFAGKLSHADLAEDNFAVFNCLAATSL
jgi:hypothetical protein